MAVRKDMVVDTINYPNAYTRIEKVEFGRKDLIVSGPVYMMCWAKTYADKPASHDEKPLCATNIYFTYNIFSQDNLWKQAYDAMKAMPEWADAVDE